MASLSLFCLAPAVGAESLNDIAELFGRADAIGNPHISPDGKHLAVECSPEVKPSICIFPLDSAGSPILLPVIQDVRLVGHSCAKSDTLILDIEVFETLHVSSGKEDYSFPRAIAFNLIDQKPVMLMKGNRSWVDTNNLAAIAPDDPDKIIFSIVAGPGDKAPHLGGRSLGEMEAISYQARDGLTIPAYLTLAPGKARGDGPFPLILLPHGGPEARDTLSFEACAAAGYAVIQPNVRGGTGCGTDFRDAGYGEFGGKMVTDILGAATWSDAEGLSVPGKPFIVGVSYGGYAALMAPLQDDAAIQCVVAVNPVTSPFKYLSDYKDGGFLVNSVERFMGGGRLDSAWAQKQVTPTSRAAEMKVPVLLIAGEEDTAVPFEQSQSFERSARGVTDVALVKMDGEEHYFRSTRAL